MIQRECRAIPYLARTRKTPTLSIHYVTGHKYVTETRSRLKKVKTRSFHLQIGGGSPEPPPVKIELGRPLSHGVHNSTSKVGDKFHYIAPSGSPPHQTFMVCHIHFPVAIADSAGGSHNIFGSKWTLLPSSLQNFLGLYILLLFIQDYTRSLLQLTPVFSDS